MQKTKKYIVNLILTMPTKRKKVTKKGRLESPKKKVTKQGGAERRKGTSRPDIAAAGVKKLLKDSSPSLRISKEAQDETTVLLQQCLEKLAIKLRSLLDITKRDTVTVEMIRKSCMDLSLADKVCDAQLAKEPKGTRYPLSVAGVLRSTKSHMGKARFTAEAKTKLVAVAMEYVEFLGRKAGCIAKKAAMRKTLKQRDIISATRC